MKKIGFLLLFFSFFVAGMNAQEDPNWYVDKPIVDIRFNGLKNISESELDGIVAPYIGEEFSDELFIELQSSLYALDYFEMFTPNAIPGDENYNSIIIEFDVEERPVVERIELRGNQSLRDGEILDAVLLKPGDMVNKTKIQLDAEAIKELYIERGYPNAEVGGEVETDEKENSAVVFFNITEGKQTRIQEIQFSGNSFASDSTLKRLMETKTQSLFSKGVFQESKLAQDLRNIETYYWENGYIDAEVIDVKREIKTEEEEEEERNFLVLIIYIDEGEQYIYGGMEIEGNSLFNDEELLSEVRLRPGEVLDKMKLEADFLRLADVYYNEGYIYNQITKDPVREEEENVVFYKVNVIERGRAHIENIIVDGNTKTKDFVITRELPFETGDVFSKEKIMEGLQNLYNTGLFSVVTPTTPMGSVEGLVDLVINIEEAKTIDFNFGVTFSGAAGSFPVLGFFKWTDRNFLGMGNEISAGVELAGVSQKLTFSFNQNWLFGRRWNWGADLSVEHALERNITQDILSPVFSAQDPNAVPDPYEGYYVFSSDTDIDDDGEIDYKSGEQYPGIPDEQAIEEYNLVTDYKYALQKGILIDDAYLMDYHSVNFSIGLNTGYQWFTRVGRIGASTGARTSLEFLTYDDTLYRPYNPTTRVNLDNWLFTNKIWTNFSWDTRDYVMNPSSGFHLNQNFQYVGGFLFGVTNYIRSSTKAEFFIPLFNVQVTENWNWKLVLALHSDFAILLPQYRRYETDDGTKAWGWGNELRDDDYLYIDSMQIARGWGWKSGGMSRWNNWIELRMPIFEEFLWWDFFFSGTAMWDENADMKGMTLDDFMFTFGGGFRLTIPGFPMGFYFAKRFRTNDGAVEWQTGNIGGTAPGKGIDFVISFTYEIF